MSEPFHPQSSEPNSAPTPAEPYVSSTQGYPQASTPPAPAYPQYQSQPTFEAYPASGYAPPPGYGVPPGYGPQGPLAPTKSVRLAVNLMFLGAALSLLNLLMVFTMRDQMREAARDSSIKQGRIPTADQLDTIVNATMAVALVSGLLGCGLWILNAVKNRQGKTWARVLSTVLGVLGLLGSLVSLFTPNPPAQKGMAILMMLLPMTILFLLWRPENKQFYEVNSAPRA